MSEKKELQQIKSLTGKLKKVITATTKKFHLPYPVICIFKNEEKGTEKVTVKNLPELISTFDKQIQKGNYFERFVTPYDPAQEPRPDLLDCALRMWCFDCRKVFFINGNFTGYAVCEYCKCDNIDHDTIYNYSKQNHK